MIDELRAPFPIDKISWRIGSIKGDKTSALALAYIDARDVRQRLNEVCKPQNWSCEHYDCGNGKLGCKLSIRIDGEWITKTDGAGATAVEADKGAFSDALKRAAVAWGIGEYLYDLKNVWVDIVPSGRSHKFKNANDPKFEGALRKLGAGIKIPDYPAFKPNAEFETLEHKNEWKQRALMLVNGIEASEEITNWINDNIVTIAALDQEEQDKLNEYCAKRKMELEDNTIGEM